MQSGVGKLSCNKTALKRCTRTETLRNRKAPSLLLLLYPRTHARTHSLTRTDTIRRSHVAVLLHADRAVLRPPFSIARSRPGLQRSLGPSFGLASSNITPSSPSTNLMITRYRPRGRRDDMPAADGSSTRGGSTSVRGRVRSPHISGGRRWLSCRQPACL